MYQKSLIKNQSTNNEETSEIEFPSEPPDNDVLSNTSSHILKVKEQFLSAPKLHNFVFNHETVVR